MKNKIVILILALFVASRFLVFGLAYHQDEYKWAMLVNPQFNIGLESDHPPLVGVLYEMTGILFGFSYLRLLPIFISIINLILIYFIAKKIYGKRAAIWTSVILLFSVYYLISSTQIDIDGALLPFFGLLSIYSYYMVDFRRFWEGKNRKWFFVFLLAIVGGFLVKLSFALFLAALGTEYILEYKPKWKEIAKFSSWVLAAIILSGLCTIALNKIFGVTNSSRFLENATNFSFLNIFSRNYSQVLFLTAKACILASPLILSGYVVGLWGIKNIIKYRFWLIYFLYNIIFYYLIFDFSNRTLERYLMFMIIPGAFMLGSYISEKTKDMPTGGVFTKGIFFSVPAILISLLLFSMHYEIFPLNPKSAYIQAIKTLHFNFLLPITGGSGPVGMYVLVSFILLFFVIAGILLVFSLLLNRNQNLVKNLIVGFVAVSLTYNVVLIAELSSGFMYGNVNKVVKETAAAVNQNPAISKVITYYDIAGYELNASGKYYKRFYTDPMFSETNVGKFTGYEGYFMVVDFPEIDKNSVYWKYLQTCISTYETRDKNIFGYIFDCRKANANLFYAEKN